MITAFKGQPSLSYPALIILKDTARTFLSSPYVRLETCPKALFFQQHDEHAFYERYFKRAVMTHSLRKMLTLANEESARSGVGPWDALHLAAAHLLNADEFITTEKPAKSIYRSSLVKVVYLYR